MLRLAFPSHQQSEARPYHGMGKRARSGGGNPRAKKRLALGASGSGSKRRRKSPAGTSKVRKAILDLKELKRYDQAYNWDIGNGQWATFGNIFTSIQTGTTSTNRDGNEIYIDRVELNFLFSTVWDRPNCIVRLIAVMTDHENIPNATSGVMPLMRINPTTAKGSYTTPLDEAKQRILLDMPVYPHNIVANNHNNLAADSESVHTLNKVTLRVNKKIHFKDSTHLLGMNHLSIAVFGLDDKGGATDKIGGGILFTSIFFKDV